MSVRWYVPLFCSALFCSMGVQAAAYQWQDKDGHTQSSVFLSEGTEKPIYKWVDENGRVQFGDHGSGNAQVLKPVAPAVKPNAKEQANQPPAGPYTTFELVKPKNNQTFATDDGTVPVGLMVLPGMQKDHKIQLFLDDSPLSAGSAATQRVLSSVSEGTHILYAQMQDATGKVLMTSPKVSFNVTKTTGTAPTH